MVKGITKRVVIVRPEKESNSFEQAVFFLKEQSSENKDALREACDIAQGYMQSTTRKKGKRSFYISHLYASFGTGAGIVAILWGISTLF